MIKYPSFGEKYRANADAKKKLTRSELKALQFKPISPRRDEYPFNILNIGLADHNDDEWNYLSKQVFEAEPLKSLLFLRYDDQSTADGDDEKEYDAEYHNKRCLALIDMYMAPNYNVYDIVVRQLT